MSGFWLGLALACGLVLTASGAAAQTPAEVEAVAETAVTMLAELSPEERRHLDDESWVMTENDDELYVTGLVVFSASLEDSMRLLTQTARQIEYRPELKGNETLERYEDGTLEQQRLKIMFNSIVYHLRYRVDYDAHRITWELDDEKDNDLRVVNGFWQLHPMSDGRTLAEFGTQVDVGALPSFLQDYATRKNVPKNLENTRRWIDSGGTWRP